MMRPQVGVVIVNWNRKADTLRCIGSVLASDYDGFQLVMVDNASTDGSTGVIRERYPSLAVVENSENLGFTGGYNAGIKHLLGRGVDYVLLLNNDAVLEPSALQALATAAALHPEAGFLGGKILAMENPDVILSAGGILDEHWNLMHRGMGELDDERLPSTSDLDFLSGSALLVSRELIETVGLLDEDFFAYYEDVEWCYRGKQSGFGVAFVREARVWHPDTRRRSGDPLVTYYLARNHLLFLSKHGMGSSAVARPLTSYLWRVAAWTVQPKWWHRRPQRDALVHAIVDFLQGRFGRAAWVE